MSYETVIIYDDDQEQEISTGRYPIDFVAGSPMTDPVISPVLTKVKIKRTSRVRVRRSKKEKSPSQDMTLASKARQIPKTLGDTNEFISAFWVNGKPKCREGYRYDFRRKMCRLIK